MKERVNRLYFFAGVLCLFGCVALLQRIKSNICAIRYISYAFDPQLSGSLRTAIEQQVALLEHEGQYRVSVVMQELLRIFPTIKQMEIRSFPYNLAEISITIPDPVVKINTSHVLTDQQTIVPANYYAHYALDRLPSIYASELISESVSTEIMAALQKSIQDHIFDRFIVSIDSEQQWRLQDKDDPLMTICCNASSLSMGTVRELYGQLKELMKKKGTTKTAWMADVRFNHQIVLSRYKGGRNGNRI
ncbi:MAG TPA: hypothetical protein VI521_00260 [Candidatus Babeliales bacterium]|nr:hypothetical protein [Candidatus Babeliales bacterium]